MGNWIESAVGDAIENMAKAVVEAFGKAIASLGTLWVNIGTPNLTGTGGSSPIGAGSSAPDAGNITTVMSYVTWISLAVAILSLFLLGGLIATRMRAGEGIVAVGRLGLVLAAVVLISAASALVTGLLPSGPTNAGGAVLFLQSSLWWYMGAAAVVSVILGGARMAWEQRAEPGRETVKSLLTLVVVAGAGVTIVGLLVAAADSFSVWLMNGSLECDVSADSACFGENMLTLIPLTSSVTGGLGALLIIILGLMAVLAAAVQIVLMVARSGMLVILTGTLPVAASFTNTEMGKGWFKKFIGWLIAFILYKPAAAVVYAAAFQLVGTDVFSDDGTGLLAVLTGLTLMIIALFAMPALMRFVTPMVGAMAGGAGGAMAVGAMAALPSGAAAIGRLAPGSGGGSSSGASGPAGSDGSAGTSGPSGTSGGQGSPDGQGAGGAAPIAAQTSGAQQAGSGAAGAGGASQSAAATSAGSGGGAAASGAGAGGASQSAAATSAGSGGGAAASGAGAGGAAASGAGAGGAAASGAGAGGAAAGGAAAGPVGIAAGAALEAGKQAGQAASGAAQSVGQEATGEGEGGAPDGSR